MCGFTHLPCASERCSYSTLNIYNNQRQDRTQRWTEIRIRFKNIYNEHILLLWFFSSAWCFRSLISLLSFLPRLSEDGECLTTSWMLRGLSYIWDVEGISFLRLQAGGCVAPSLKLTYMYMSPPCAWIKFVGGCLWSYQGEGQWEVMICDWTRISLPRAPEYLDLLVIRVNNVLAISSVLVAHCNTQKHNVITFEFNLNDQWLRTMEFQPEWVSWTTPGRKSVRKTKTCMTLWPCLIVKNERKLQLWNAGYPEGWKISICVWVGALEGVPEFSGRCVW